MPNSTVIVLAAAAVVFAVLGGEHGNSHTYAYNQGFKTGASMRQRAGMPMESGSAALLMYCRRAPYTADIPTRNAAQWLAGYDAGCDGH
jgi:hypothetical protein